MDPINWTNTVLQRAYQYLDFNSNPPSSTGWDIDHFHYLEITKRADSITGRLAHEIRLYSRLEVPSYLCKLVLGIGATEQDMTRSHFAVPTHPLPSRVLAF
ncbi:hypothetical protein G9A89_000449 [Geosiphon pyriformis]|nr:hypothetical protein G9A89_000449 [Geosiphon pyriformis]